MGLFRVLKEIGLWPLFSERDQLSKYGAALHLHGCAVLAVRTACAKARSDRLPTYHADLFRSAAAAGLRSKPAA